MFYPLFTQSRIHRHLECHTLSVANVILSNQSFRLFIVFLSDITMSFRFSQSLLDNLTSSNPGASGSFSQELDNSQDSGYSASGGTQASSSTYFPHNFGARPPLQTRRTLPRPPTWPNINIQQPQLRGGSKWKFVGRQEREGRSTTSSGNIQSDE